MTSKRAANFSPIAKLDVYRCLSNAKKIRVGTLAQNSQGVYFQYYVDYLNQQLSLSPFQIPFDNVLHRANTQQKLYGVFTDSLPDGWGHLLMDRVFRQHNILPQQVTAMDRLAYVADRGMGALHYQPQSEYQGENSAPINLSALGEQAEAVYEGQSSEVLSLLANAGSSGGARPKAQIYLKEGFKTVSTQAGEGLDPWLIKFTSQQLALGHEESLCEAAYLTMAAKADIEVPEWQLIEAGKNTQATAWLALKRFDCTKSGGRYHMHSASGLLDADFLSPSLDYEDLIKASQLLCNSPAVAQQQFTRAIFNLFACNQDDHTKNWAFLQDDQGQWRPSPFYDVTFSPNPHGQYSMAFLGYGKKPSLKAMQQLAKQANFSSWPQAQKEIQKVLDALSSWKEIASELGVSSQTIKLINSQLDRTYQENKVLLQ